MPEQSKELARRLREVILNGTWIANTNYKNELHNSDWQLAVTQIDTLNSIAAIAQHVHYYIEGISNVFQGGDLEIRDKYGFNFLALNSQNDWDRFLNRFWLDAENLANLFEQFPDEQLSHVFVDEKYGSYQRNMEAMIEHSYYHLGQIVLIKKLCSNEV